MRQKDYGIIFAVVFFSAVLSVLLSRMVFAKPENRQKQVEVVQAISADFPQADERYFNAGAIDPTQPIQIGNNNNPDPFRGNPVR